MIDFIQPIFNQFTLEFPPLTAEEQARNLRPVVLDLRHETTAERISKEKAVKRRTKRGQKRLMLNWLVFRPGFVTPPPNGRTTFEYTPCRQQRKATLHAQALDLLHGQSAVEVFGAK